MLDEIELIRERVEARCEEYNDFGSDKEELVKDVCNWDWVKIGREI